MIRDSRLLDAPAEGMEVNEVLRAASDYELVVIHTSTATLQSDTITAERLKERSAHVRIGFVGPHATVSPEGTVSASKAVDFAAIGEFDYTIGEISHGIPLKDVRGIAFRQNGAILRTAPRPPVENLDLLPFVTEVYARDLRPENYFIGYLRHPYVSLYAGRGCRSRCTFCLWPQTIAGRLYRVRSAQNVLEEMARAKALFPQAKEFFFDDDTFTDNPHAGEIAVGLGELGITWSCNARANVPKERLGMLKENGLRLLVVGFESGNQEILDNVRKGIRLDQARLFMKAARQLDIQVHGTFILGLPGETEETMERTIRFARELDPYSIQVSLAAPYPGTELYDQAKRNGWLAREGDRLVREGIQDSALSYEDLPAERIFDEVDRFYRRFYFRAGPILRILREMLADRDVFRRRIREGREFFSFMARRKEMAKGT
jgi:hopanoid biosynthesis associated radical SAM protein HpnJ